MRIIIKELTFEEILPVWRDNLWPGRTSIIESNSALTPEGSYDMKNMEYPAYFQGAYIEGLLAGVNSCHQCEGNTFRSRGLYVFDKYRGLGVGKMLLKEAIFIASYKRADMIWSVPREKSIPVYEAAGYRVGDEWNTTDMEYGPNCYAEFKITSYPPISFLKSFRWEKD